MNLLPLVPPLEPPVWWTLGAMFTAMLVGTGIRWASLRKADTPEAESRLASLRTWWILAGLLAANVLLGPVAICVTLTVVGWLGLREYFAITAPADAVRPGQWLALAIVPVHYLLVGLGQLGAAWLLLPLILVGLCLAEGGTSPRGAFFWKAWIEFRGVLLVVFCLSHAVLLFTARGEDVSYSQAAGRFLFLVLLTELNDISQALWGRRLGVHKITPVLSPHKTWEGLIGGAITTVLAAVALGYGLSSWNQGPGWLFSGLAGLMISLGGFAGDLSISAIKRQAGVKDSGDLLPGMGGVLDRIDSLNFTAPLFFYFVCFAAE
ncbi:phosphatidate cytidylyltransferase [Lignipirellula cremea]|uniref:Phosphatidate cytidylyltransferase n=1 Tax=Lignipirellula cremea TaxID=2528010 RepID=A0A518DWV4_9BACT|nr:phosphatidate cytidylyltransferase [Lignipirellula cremea]QDU96313.1 Phosphatidate cytidylyltransferase [Lignipirellula cremea]